MKNIILYLKFIKNKYHNSEINMSYIRFKEAYEVINGSLHFDLEYYVKNHTEKDRCSSLLRYILIEESKGKKPNPLFNPIWYKKKYNIGSNECALSHYLVNKESGNLSANPLFYESWYLKQNSDVRNSGMDPFIHYIKYGENENRKPNPYFCPKFYRENYKDVEKSGLMMLEHYIEHAKFNHQPNPLFNNSWFKMHNMPKHDMTHPLNYYNNKKGIGVSECSPSFSLKDFENVYSEYFNCCLKSKETLLSIILNIEDKPEWLKNIEKFGFRKPKSFDNLIIDGNPMKFRNISLEIKDEIFRHVLSLKERISVILPTYNRVDIISEAINSFLKQRYKSKELIIIDDCSSDSTYEFINKKYKKEILEGNIKVHRLEKHRGQSAARNIGLEHASGEIIAYLDSDNSWFEDTLTLYAYTLSKYEALSVYTPIEVKENVSLKDKIIGRKYCRIFLLKNNFIDINGFAHKSKLVKEFGGFNEKLTRLVDWEFIIRLTRKHEPVYLPIISTNYRTKHDSYKTVTKSQPININYEKIQAINYIEMARYGIINIEKIILIIQKGYLESQRSKRDINNNLASKLCVVLDREYCKEYKHLMEIKRKLNVECVILIKQSKNYLDAESGKIITTLYEVDCEYFYYPTSKDNILTKDAIMNCLLSIFYENLDVAICSNGFDKLPKVNIFLLRDSLFLTKKHAISFINEYKFNGAIFGKVLNIIHNGFKISNTIIIHDCLRMYVNFNNNDGTFWTAGTMSNTIFQLNRYIPRFSVNYRKPRILCLAMKVAVGGVERLTLDTMKALKNNYSFIYLALEPINSSSGSLHSEISSSVDYIIEGDEVCSKKKHLEMMSHIVENIKPELVWITNGSVWLHQNIQNIKNIFNGLPIIDQECYDHNFGWIEKLKKSDFQGFEHYIAINDKIEYTFKRECGFSQGSITKIKHGLCLNNAMKTLKYQLSDIYRIKSNLNLPKNKNIWCFVGRLTEQKNPLMFLELAKNREKFKYKEHFVLVGDGELKHECMKYISDNNMENVTMFDNIMPISKLYSVSDGLIITSHYEGLPLALIEAAFVGLPILSPFVGEIPNLINKYKIGYIYKNNDIEDLGKKFLKYILHNKDLKKQAVSCRNAIYNEYSIEHVSKKYMELFDKYIEKRSDNDFSNNAKFQS
ncbi:glycosyltransferase [Grimontia hollisae]|uniref:glycosyltransferase n=1 Tax=Grimontia hollisae TaxID=673 RepID=UPI00165E65CD|nr:glycosyltransferase [Grimontia hollisae]